MQKINATPTASTGVDYFQVAKSLGIDTQNKNEKQVKDEIAHKEKVHAARVGDLKALHKLLMGGTHPD